MDWLNVLLILGILALVVVGLLGGRVKIGRGGLELNTSGLLENLRKAEESRGHTETNEWQVPEQVAQIAEKGGISLPLGNVLWVDDHPINNFWERRALADIGVAVDSYVDNSEAMQAFDMGRYDLVVSDIGRDSTQEDGFKLLSEVRQRDADIPFYFYTVNLDDSKVQMAKEAGANDAFEAPAELLKAILASLQTRPNSLHAG